MTIQYIKKEKNEEFSQIKDYKCIQLMATDQFEIFVVINI